MPVFLTTIADYHKYKVRKNMTNVVVNVLSKSLARGVTDGEIGQAKSRAPCGSGKGRLKHFSSCSNGLFLTFFDNLAGYRHFDSYSYARVWTPCN